MKMKIFLGLFILVVLVSCQDKAVETKPPNIIFIMTDDHARSATSCYGSQLMTTTNIDRIAHNGLQFNNAFVTNSICGPSRAVFLTGKYSHNNGFKSNFDSFDGSQATLPKYLQQVGYYTSVQGKWHLKSKPEGFDEYSVLIDQGEYYSPQFTNGEDTVVVKGYSANIITDKALAVMDKVKQSEKPFFLMINHKAPHRNWMPDSIHLKSMGEQRFAIPKSFYDNYFSRSKAMEMADMRIADMYLGFDLKMKLKGGQEEETGTGGDPKAPSYKWWNEHYDRMNEQEKKVWDAYYNPIIEKYYKDKLSGKALLEWKFNRFLNDYVKSIQSVDDNIGRVLDYLEDNDLTKNTLVIYTSDQGFFLGEHGWYDKRFMYEPSLTIPLVMQYPEKLKEAKQVNLMVQNVDLAPTILDLAGVAIPQDMQGKSLAPFFETDKEGETVWRDKIYYHYYQTGIWHFAQRHLGLRTKRYKLIYFYDLDDWELYDLKHDPEEVNNLYRNQMYAPLADSLKLELKDLIREVGDTTAVKFWEK